MFLFYSKEEQKKKKKKERSSQCKNCKRKRNLVGKIISEKKSKWGIFSFAVMSLEMRSLIFSLLFKINMKNYSAAAANTRFSSSVLKKFFYHKNVYASAMEIGEM